MNATRSKEQKNHNNLQDNFLLMPAKPKILCILLHTVAVFDLACTHAAPQCHASALVGCAPRSRGPAPPPLKESSIDVPRGGGTRGGFVLNRLESALIAYNVRVNNVYVITFTAIGGRQIFHTVHEGLKEAA